MRLVSFAWALVASIGRQCEKVRAVYPALNRVWKKVFGTLNHRSKPLKPRSLNPTARNLNCASLWVLEPSAKPYTPHARPRILHRDRSEVPDPRPPLSDLGKVQCELCVCNELRVEGSMIPLGQSRSSGTSLECCESSDFGV